MQTSSGADSCWTNSTTRRLGPRVTVADLTVCRPRVALAPAGQLDGSGHVTVADSLYVDLEWCWLPHTEHRWQWLEERCRKPVLGVWLAPPRIALPSLAGLTSDSSFRWVLSSKQGLQLSQGCDLAVNFMYLQ